MLIFGARFDSDTKGPGILLLPGRLVTNAKLLSDKLNCSPSQLHYACSRSSAAEEAMPDTLIHALKISASLGMRVRQQIWKT